MKKVRTNCGWYDSRIFLRRRCEQLVAESLGNISASCDGCRAGIVEMYQDYIDGKKELKDINMEFRAGYVSGNEQQDQTDCGMY